jgi:hypothetical protein
LPVITRHWGLRTSAGVLLCERICVVFQPLLKIVDWQDGQWNCKLITSVFLLERTCSCKNETSMKSVLKETLVLSVFESTTVILLTLKNSIFISNVIFIPFHFMVERNLELSNRLRMLRNYERENLIWYLNSFKARGQLFCSWDKLKLLFDSLVWSTSEFVKLWYAYRQWHTDLVRNNQRVRHVKKKSYNKCNYIENSINLFFI